LRSYGWQATAAKAVRRSSVGAEGNRTHFRNSSQTARQFRFAAVQCRFVTSSAVSRPPVSPRPTDRIPASPPHLRTAENGRHPVAARRFESTDCFLSLGRLEAMAPAVVRARRDADGRIPVASLRSLETEISRTEIARVPLPREIAC
jgi:hypothetical protein